MRSIAWTVLFYLVGCGSKPAPATPETVPDAAASAFAAYREYCGLCPRAETCCLKQQDFTPGQWSARAGPYLRAMRGYYECQRSATLDHAASTPALSAAHPRDGFGEFTGSGNIQHSCYPHGCSDFAEQMALQLDVARANAQPHASGALVICAADVSAP